MQQPNFTIPENAFFDDTDINSIYQQSVTIRKKYKKLKSELEDVEKEFKSISKLLTNSIQQTGGKAWSKEKGFSAEINECVYLSCTVDHRLELIEYAAEIGRDDLIKVAVKSLAKALKEEAATQDVPFIDFLDKNLPKFVTYFKETKLISLRANGKSLYSSY